MNFTYAILSNQALQTGAFVQRCQIVAISRSIDTMKTNKCSFVKFVAVANEYIFLKTIRYLPKNIRDYITKPHRADLREYPYVTDFIIFIMKIRG
ncbi:hypothetical protein C0081_01140 [Cohaesibacter celericrescens]|uniref:Uncharacterized protein n=1 Tax=Cohaesibacter celericrescens TaxID=2067669 RepID=A0A2N5XLS6_9HYPH|nr:hypothetical protein C0081_19180 [Cohaesibacter celericrescens]PLW78876.1 hypothetical protein C0081_01140 [Cohaesibacter celericrescens]